MPKFKKLLKWIFDIGMYLNIAAIAPQPYKIFNEKTAAGVSIWMWLLFFVFQLAISLHGKINLQSKPMFWGMGGSAVVSLATVILILIYG